MNEVLEYSTTRNDVSQFLEGASISITPDAADNFPDFRDHLKSGTTVYIGLLPGDDYRDVVRTAARLHQQGYRIVPHFTARNLASRVAVEDYLDSICAVAAVDEVLVLAGDLASPIGDFHSSMQLLQTGLFDKHDIKHIGVAGHPEGTPDISAAEQSKALLEKNAFARNTDANLYILTQFCFDAEAVIAWEKKIQAAGNTLPICVGIAGPLALGPMIKVATKCKVGQSIRMASRLAVARTRAAGDVAPDKMVASLVDHKRLSPVSDITGCHFFSFGNLKRLGKWLNARTFRDVSQV